MKFKLLLLWLVGCTALFGQTSAAAPALSQEQIVQLIRQVAEHDRENDKKQRQYAYVERDEEHRLNGKGEVKSTETRTYDVIDLYGEDVRRLTAKDDKALSARDVAKEEEKIQKIIDRRKSESEGERNKRLRREEKDREDSREFVQEIADAYNFRLDGMESFNGRESYVIAAEPRPGFVAHRKEAKFLPKFRGTVWIDKADTEWVKLNIECIDTVAIGWVLARIHKGSRFAVEQVRVNDEVWLPKHMAVKVDLRLALFKGFNIEQDVKFSDFKKFRTGTRIVPIGEVPETK